MSRILGKVLAVTVLLVTQQASARELITIGIMQFKAKVGVSQDTADVLADNHGMLRAFHKCGFPIESDLQDGVYRLRIPFDVKRKSTRRKPRDVNEADTVASR